jgi:hypothetical protein
MQVRSINSVHANKPYHVDLKISNEELRFKIDTGADETIISLEDYNMKLRKKIKLEKTNAVLVGPGEGHRQLKVWGQIRLPVKVTGKTESINGYVVSNKENLLGRLALEQLRIVKWVENRLKIQKSISQIQTQEFQQEVFKKYPKLFHGIGNLKEYEYEIKLKENADPVQVSAPRRVPFPLLKEVEKEIKRMEKEGVIEKIEEPTNWCSPMVIASKINGKVRVCADFTELNAYVKREKFQLPSVDETLSKLQDAKFFSKLDFSSGFWQINLEKNSQKLTTFGRYKYKRIPFGIAPEVFQKVLYEILSKLKSEQVQVHADDILITGRTIEEHDRNLHSVTPHRRKWANVEQRKVYTGCLMKNASTHNFVIYYPISMNKKIKDMVFHNKLNHKKMFFFFQLAMNQTITFNTSLDP